MMQLRITHRGNELLTFPVELSTSVADVKSFIANNFGLPSSDIILTVNGCYLEDERRLEDYSVKDFGSLQLHLPIDSLKIVSVRVIASPEEVHSIPMRSDSTVANLRAEINKRVSTQSFDPQNAFLVYSHYILEDSRTLEDYGIDDNVGIIIAHVLDAEKGPSTEPYDYCEDIQEDQTQASGPRMISIHFLVQDGDPITFMLDPSKPLRNVSNSIKIRTGIPSNNQGFIISGEKVDPEMTPEELGLKEGESIYLNDERVIYPSGSKSMDITINLDRLRLQMKVPGDCTVREVIRAVQNHHAVNGQRIDLFFKDTRLDPVKFLYEYGITNGSVIDVGTHFF